MEIGSFQTQDTYHDHAARDDRFARRHELHERAVAEGWLPVPSSPPLHLITPDMLRPVVDRYRRDGNGHWWPPEPHKGYFGHNYIECVDETVHEYRGYDDKAHLTARAWVRDLLSGEWTWGFERYGYRPAGVGGVATSEQTARQAACDAWNAHQRGEVVAHAEALTG